MARTRATHLTAPTRAGTARRLSALSGSAGTALLYALLIVVLIAMAVPFAWMIAGSFKTNTDMFGNALTLLPTAPTLRNYVDLLNGSQVPYLRQYANSAIVAAGTTLLALAVSSLTGYGFAKFE